jgi:hypothetical protein
MKAFIRKRPWVVIVAVQAGFVAWWVSFLFYAMRHTPRDSPSTSEVRASR